MTSSGAKWDLQWSPTDPDVFVALNTDRYDMNLYTVESDLLSSSQSQIQLISQDSNMYARLQASKTDLYVSTKSDLQLIRCFCWCPKQSSDDILAVGLSSGKVILTAFLVDPTSSQMGLVGTEFPVKHNKMCTSLAWNTVEPKLLAAGFDRYRTDYCMAVYDVSVQITGTGSTTSSEKSRFVSNNTPQSAFRPVSEMVQAEALNSMAWLPHQPQCIVAGVSNKNLRIFDIRDTTSYKSATATKAVYGLTADPVVEYRLASYYESQVHIWDRRHFDKPVLTITEPRPIVKLAWSPSRYGLLASLARDSSVVKLYNVQHVDSEVEHTERHLQPSRAREVSMFAWHPTCENRVLTVTPTGTFRDVTIQDRISLTVSPQSTCMLASGRNLLLVTPAKSHQVKDISAQMKQRAIDGYGLQKLLIKNGDLVGDSEEEVQLQKFWRWLDRIMALQKEDRATSKGWIKSYGVKSLIKCEDGLKSVIESIDWKGVDWYSESNVFRSKERACALQLCGWEFDQDEQAFQLFILRLEKDNEYERAAAICVFQLRIRQAIDILNRGAKDTTYNGYVNLNGIAMALSGFTQQRNTLWCEMCSTLRQNLQHPYLQAMFGFLTADGDTYDVVLKEPGLSMEDRIAFACLFLNDQQLPSFIEELMNGVIQTGNLEGMLLAGLTKDGVELLQSYVDRTADVQTTSWVAVRTLPSELCKDRRVMHWIESYRSLLDIWRLWHQRARFDVYYHQGNVKIPPQQQIFVNCHFCQNAISPTVLAQRSLHNIPHRGVPMHQRVKASTCYKCRKPLPRCALCLMNMGTLSGLKSIHPQDRHDNAAKNALNTDPHDESKQTDFKQWFTWCQSCRHGGHACHLMDWFKEHPECPVTGCVCKCMLMDTVGTVSSTESVT
ncbi:GATOR complex protein MIOS-A-like [Asterias rubens]|uniref:GATOR complex protein MIOS-A-like n=1 Tax=Asterias rubens TaxID=7604 RepID=UPI0014550104|nr:GATOR complex protein MIOS-A-like [Asterias rubens]